ncbi:MAG: hypothetical protein IKY37_02655 [Bacteroidaceae bacterium]|nr:hypothetical protein [Bacteroidaceae bacterium]
MGANKQSLIQSINKDLQWIKKYHPEDYDQRFLQLVEERRKLRKIIETEKDNPAIAAYGISQVGKSYLMSNMLQREVTRNNEKVIVPFEVEADGQKYNFIDQINPITKDTEATGVVTRFSSFKKDPSRFSKEYPVLMRCLSVTDITLILCDGYFHDVQDPTTDSRNEIDEYADSMYAKYKDYEPRSILPVTPDDILEMKCYFQKYIKAQEINKSNIFDKLALVIDRIPIDDYVELFSYFWAKEPTLTQLYKRILRTLSILGYYREVYLKVDAVLHKGANENTIMSVECLNGLGNDENEFVCSAYLKQTDGSFIEKPSICKSELSAICAEVVYYISPEFQKIETSYDMQYISPDVRGLLPSGGKVNENMLADTDLLDFPGARARQHEQKHTLHKKEVFTKVLLRGKVAYLFNKYSESRAVNILLYCHDNRQNDVTPLYITLNEWVNQYIGKTSEERARTIQLADGISPLFYVATKFNIDMAEDQNPAANERTALNGRWTGRFKKVLYKECFNAGSVDWVRNWTGKDIYFQNSYLLRDYKYSGPKGSKLYAGFKETGRENGLLVEEAFLQLLRESFCESDDAAIFFNNRPLSWDVAATMNNDGALYIIQNLSRAAAAMTRVRDNQFNEIFAHALTKVINIMKEYYVSDDTSELLTENIRKAYRIFSELELTCQRNPEYFGNLLQALQFTESQSYTEVHSLLPKLTSAVNDEKIDYELIRSRCSNFEGCNNQAEMWDRLITVYGYPTQQEALAALQARGIDIERLFQGARIKRLNSSIIADTLLNIWISNITSVGFMNTFAGDDKLTSYVLSNLTACIQRAVENQKLLERIEQEIAEYTNILNVANINEDLVADMIATKISDFILDFGFLYHSEEQVKSLMRVAEEHKLPCFKAICQERKEEYDEDEMTSLLNDILCSSSRFTPAYEANYNRWLEYMFISFISNINVPNYNKEANDALKILLSEHQI